MGAHVRVTAAIIGAANINEMIMAERRSSRKKAYSNEGINNNVISGMIFHEVSQSNLIIEPFLVRSTSRISYS